MFDGKSTENEQLKEFSLSICIFGGIGPTFHKGPHSLITICVEQYPQNVDQICLDILLDFEFALSHLQGFIELDKLIKVKDR